MPQAGAAPQIDWDQELANKPAAGPGINWDQELANPPAPKPPAAQGTLSARPDHPIRNWLEDVQSDVHSGGTLTLPGRVLHSLGAQGLDKGVSPGTEQAMEGLSPLGLVTGPMEASHGAIDTFDPDSNRGQRVRGVNEILGGAGKTLGGVLPFASPAHLPQVVPTLATYGPVQQGAQAVASKAGADPDEAQLVGNVSALALPYAKSALGGVGHGVSAGAGPIAKGVGLLEGAHELSKGRVGTGLATMVGGATPFAEHLVKGVGDLAASTGDAPLLPHEAAAADTSPSGDGNLDAPRFMPGSRNYMGMKPQPETPQGEVLPPEPKALPRGAIIPPEPAAPEDEPGQLVNAQAISTRGKGGKFTKQFLTGADESEGKSVPSATQGQAWQTPEGSPLGPPQIIRGGKMAVRGDLVQRPHFDVETGTNGSEEPVNFSGPFRNGDQSTITPRELWHGTNEDVNGKPLVANVPHDMEGEANPEEHRGVYLAPDAETAGVYGKNIHRVDVPPRTVLRNDPLDSTASVVPGDIPASRQKLVNGGSIEPQTKPLVDASSLSPKPTATSILGKQLESKGFVLDPKNTDGEGRQVFENPEGQMAVVSPKGTYVLKNPGDPNHYTGSSPEELDGQLSKKNDLVKTQPLTNGPNSGNMNDMDKPENPSRRSFLKKGAGAVAGSVIPKKGIVGKALGAMVDPSNMNLEDLSKHIGQHLYGDPNIVSEFASYNGEDGDLASATADLVENHIDNLWDMGPLDPSFKDSVEVMKKAAPYINAAYKAMGSSRVFDPGEIAREIVEEPNKYVDQENEAGKLGEEESAAETEPEAGVAEEAGGNQLIKTAALKAGNFSNRDNEPLSDLSSTGKSIAEHLEGDPETYNFKLSEEGSPEKAITSMVNQGLDNAQLLDEDELADHLDKLIKAHPYISQAYKQMGLEKEIPDLDLLKSDRDALSSSGELSDHPSQKGRSADIEELNRMLGSDNHKSLGKYKDYPINKEKDGSLIIRVGQDDIKDLNAMGLGLSDLDEEISGKFSPENIDEVKKAYQESYTRYAHEVYGDPLPPILEHLSKVWGDVGPRKESIPSEWLEKDKRRN